MPNSNPFDEIFEDIADLFFYLQDNKEKVLKGEKLDDGVEEGIAELEKGVAFFRQITEEALKRSGIEEEGLKKTIQHPTDQIGSREKHLLEKAKRLRGEVEEMAREFERKSKALKLQKKRSKSEGKKRKKKFKKLGGQGWMPL